MNMKKTIQRILPTPISKNIGSIIKGGTSFAANIIFTKVLNTKSIRGPLFISWLVTYDCNAFCKFCSTHILKKRFQTEVGLERSLEIAHEIGKAKTFAVGFTGGEVFLYPHLFEIIKVLKKYNVIVYIVTNGLMLKEKAEEIIDANVDYIVVSIDSNRAEEHNAMRNAHGLFEKIIEGIDHLKSRRKIRPLIKSTTVVSRYNLMKLDEILKYLEAIVDISSIQPVVGGYVSGPHGKSDGSMQAFMFDCTEQKYVDEIFRRVIQNNPDFNSKYFKLIPDYWFHRDDLIKRIHCWSPFLRLQILPNGDVFHCTANANYSSVGNINKSSLLEIWNGSEMIHQREEIRLHKNNCICWTQDTAFNAFLDAVPCIKKIPILNKKRV